ncbi:unnamed protein product [Brugia timori]|uniref:Coiled-coil domain-containing protein n=1 Tax=Brugia timori TaxID=42155 RepID=A0A0R3QSD6_9BILA|nr:unnamed protein product [Brugia timori]
MTDSTSVRHEIDELEKRLMKMDFKLETAKKARIDLLIYKQKISFCFTKDEYVDFLREKYPTWKPPKMQMYKQTSTLNQFQRSIIDDLATNRYHWDFGKHFMVPHVKLELDYPEPSDPIPSSGPALESDLVRIKKRLGEIAEDLESLREHRLHLSTTEYYLSLEPKFYSSKSQEMPWKKNIAQLKSLHELRTQINQIDASVLLDTPRPDVEDYEQIRMEYLQNDQDEGNFEQLLNEKEENANMISTEHRKGSNYLQETQYTEANLTRRETYDLCQVLNAQRDDQKSLSQEITAAKSRPTETESTSQASNLPKAINDGFDFLTKILGTSANDAVGKQPAFMDRFNDGILKTVDLNTEDSDSDFFA